MSTPPGPPPLPPSMVRPAPVPAAPRRRNWLVIGLLGFLGLCGVCALLSAISAIAGGDRPTATVVAQGSGTVPAGTIIAAGGGRAATATVAPTLAPRPTEAARPASTATPRPTTTPRPEPTARPTTTPVPPPRAYGLNELVSVKNWDLAVVGVERPGKELVWSQFGNKTAALGTWIVVAIDMKNTGRENFGVNTFDFELRDGGGVIYKYSSEFGAYSYGELKGGQRIGGQVPPGVVVRYYAVFDIAPTARGLQLVFKQDSRPAFAVGDAGP